MNNGYVGPRMEQLQETLRNGDVSKQYVLILNFDGNFVLIEGLGGDVATHMTYVTRWETFDAYSNYVGEVAANDHYFNSLYMKWAMYAWNEYTTNGSIKIVNLMS